MHGFNALERHHEEITFLKNLLDVQMIETKLIEYRDKAKIGD